MSFDFSLFNLLVHFTNKEKKHSQEEQRKKAQERLLGKRNVSSTDQPQEKPMTTAESEVRDTQQRTAHPIDVFDSNGFVFIIIIITIIITR